MRLTGFWRSWWRRRPCFLICCENQERTVRTLNTDTDSLVGIVGLSVTGWEVGTVFLAKALNFCSIPKVNNSTANSSGSFLQCKTYHGILGISSPTDSSLVVNVLEAAKRKLAKRVTKREPVTAELMQCMYTSLYQEGNVYNQRIMCAMSTAGISS